MWKHVFPRNQPLTVIQTKWFKHQEPCARANLCARLTGPRFCPLPRNSTQVGSPGGTTSTFVRPPPTPNPVGVEQNACHTAHPAPLPPQRLAQPSLPRSNSFSSRRASLLSRRSCLSISSLIRLASFASSLRQHAIMDSRVILSPLFPETRTFPLFLLLLIHPDFQKREKEQACLKMPNSPHTGLRAGK